RFDSSRWLLDQQNKTGANTACDCPRQEVLNDIAGIRGAPTSGVADLCGDHLFLWGIWDLVIAALALFAGYSLLRGDMFGRIVAYVWAGLVIVQSFMI